MTKNNLYFISQTENNDWDTIDSAVVCASSEDEARNIDPRLNQDGEQMFDTGSWALSPENVEVKYLGTASPTLKVGVIIESFNAG